MFNEVDSQYKQKFCKIVKTVGIISTPPHSRVSLILTYEIYITKRLSEILFVIVFQQQQFML